MSDDELPEYKESPPKSLESDRYAIQGKLRRIRLLEDQLQEVKEDLEERLEIHEELDREFSQERGFKERKLERVERFGSLEDGELRKRELRNRIENLKQEQWRENVRAWRDSQDLLREARGLNRALNDLRLRLEGLKDYFRSER
ncbi:hypothetical protein AKJ45_02365 [candidate division MSBL1 archaeon SCGC-AAA261F19]|uniref:Uncharacterized protein n=2 Tax=candidate division MSBL1 TaxID=215777 RepID=A0A133V9P2_9EURY|nr:hypothetical protein AKJ45_02365 [candidate division MSBL1 archaeon SCGC-AAA261F19]